MTKAAGWMEVTKENRVQFYKDKGMGPGNFKVLNSNKKCLKQGKTKDMGMLYSHLIHKYESNKTYLDIDRSKTIRIYFQETITTPVVKAVKVKKA